MTSAEQQIRDLHATWITAVNAGDLARLFTLMTDDVIFLSPGQPPFGRDEFSATFTAAHQQAAICCVSELEEVIVAGEIAYTRSRDAVTVTPREGRAVTRFTGNRMTIYRKQASGHWLFARDAHTLTLAEKL